MTTIRDMQAEVHALAVSKGWHEGQDYSDPNTVAAKLMLVVSEVSEALECVRDGKMDTVAERDRFGLMKPEGFPSELADVVIRCLDLAGALDIDLQGAILLKTSFNRTRPHRHGGRRL